MASETYKHRIQHPTYIQYLPEPIPYASATTDDATTMKVRRLARRHGRKEQSLALLLLIPLTHCNHLGERVSVDHIFLRSIQTKTKQTTAATSSSCDETRPANREIGHRCSALAMGYLDSKGTRILNVRSDNIQLEGRSVLSDHRPVTAKIAWPRSNKPWKEVLSSELYANATWPLDPLEPAWGIIVEE